MASAARTTTQYPIDQASIDSFRASYVTPLRSAFAAGQPMTAAAFNLLKSAVVAFNAHTHDSTDYSAIGEFGNNGPRTVVAANPRTSAAMSSPSTPVDVTAGSVITPTIVNSHVDACNAVRNHVHQIEDTPT